MKTFEAWANFISKNIVVFLVILLVVYVGYRNYDNNGNVLDFSA